eukprot:CAMPEP_0119003834 /NCGR_PEP_ID=MMETSP1176-20130426/793_1 /TAXON_ID=265551 /ORGANISM="Synedropsis recta cf, Strain CCMP1620" /LENGTH=220 /DNA_ID=CAMNT_0006955471 /DNA_START=33 /DNA_END=695 /DNA_ORIENTATION=+
MPPISATPHFDDCTGDSCSSAEFDKSNMLKKQPEVQYTTSKKKKVSFNKLVFVRETLHIANYEHEEKRNTWFTKTEMRNIKVGMAATLRAILSGEYQGDDDRHCARGLEFRSRAGARKRKENKLMALEAVLKEQDDQYDDGIVNPTAISVVYQQVSLRPRISAHERGMNDEIAAYGDRRIVSEEKPFRMLFGESAKRKTRSRRLLRESSQSSLIAKNKRS